MYTSPKILLAESGSTKTDWRLLGQHSFETIGLNPYFVNSETVAKELQAHIYDLTSETVQEVHFYGTGITDPSKGEIIAEGIRKCLGQNVQVHTYSDVMAAARALFGNEQGIACILGTGSNTCLWTGEALGFQIPPLGFWLGDEGSGGHLGKSLLLAYLHREMPVHVRSLFEKKYGAKDRLEILEHAYKRERPNQYFAQYSYFLLENEADPWCTDLIETCFRAFFEKYLMKYPQVREVPLGAVGSIAHYYRRHLEKVAASFGVHFSKIVQKPIDELAKYHQR